MAMDLNFSQESFAFSDIAPPSHVSGLESFSDFDASECSETSFAEIAVKKDGEAKDGTASTEKGISQPVSLLEKSNVSNADDGWAVVITMVDFHCFQLRFKSFLLVYLYQK